MKQYIGLILLFISFTLFAQEKDIWFSFPNKDTTLIGFKDKNGVIKIEPKFMGLTTASKFENIISVSEEFKDSWKSYYLTKTGKIVGRDSLYIFDNSPDCENEGFIRFRDPKTDKMGVFNAEGKIVIPADYSNLTKVRNGVLIALKDAKKEIDGEHFFWTGGKEFLIDINNKILIENFPYNDELNFYTLDKSQYKGREETREYFLGVDGQYYSFINFDKEFKSWLKNKLFPDLSKENLSKASFDKIIYWKEPMGWTSESKSKFIDQNYQFIKMKLKGIITGNSEYFVSSNGLNPFIYEANEYEKYFNNCREAIDWLYPVKSIIISSKNKADSGQDHFEFLRTENGYKLIGVSDAKDSLK